MPCLLAACLLAASVVAGCTRDPERETAGFEPRPLEAVSAAGSIGPHLAAAPGLPVVLSWVEPRDGAHALLYAVLGTDGWSEPRSVMAGNDWFVNWADFPSVTPLSGNLWAAHWLVRQPAGGYAYDVFVSLSSDGGTTWSEAVKPHNDGTPTEHGFVTLFPRGAGAGLIWLDGRKTMEPPSHEGVTNGMTLRAATLTREGTIVDAAVVDGLTCDCCQTDVALTQRGAIAVYRDRTEGEIRDIYAARLAEDGWRPGRAVAEDGWKINGCPVNGPVVASEGDHLAVAWFTGADDQPRVRVTRSPDAGMTWTAPVDVAGDGTSGHTGLALLPDGAVAVSWICDRPAGASVCLRTVSADDERGPVHVVSGAGGVPPFSVPQLVRDGQRLIAAWTEKSGNTTRIASAIIPIASLP